MDDNLDFFVVKLEPNNLGDLLNEHRKEKKFTDVQLKIGDKLFDAHRVVLSANSPVLGAAISEQWSTTKTCSISEEYVDVEIVEDLLSFFYTRSIQLTPDNVHAVSMAAHFLQIPTLLEPSIEYLCRLITTDNVLSIFSFSNACQLEVLRDNCLEFIKVYNDTILKSSSILEVSSKDFKDLIAGLKDSASVELTPTRFCKTMLLQNTYECIVRWTEKNRSERLNDLPILLKNIPLEEFPFKFLTKVVPTHSLVNDSIACQVAVSAAITNYRAYSKIHRKQSLVVFQKNQLSCPMRYLDSDGETWMNLTGVPSSILTYVLGATAIDQHNIVLFGLYFDENQRYNTVVTYCCRSQSWKKLPKLPFEISFASLAIWRSDLYVSGDKHLTYKDRKSFQEVVLCYSFTIKKWNSIEITTLCTIDSALRSQFLVECNDSLYLIDSKMRRIKKYEKALRNQNKWPKVAKMKLRNDDLSTVVHQDKIYACGHNSFEVFDPETGVCTELPSPPLCRTSFVSLNGKLLAVGGLRKNDNQPTDLIYEFNLWTKEWNEFGKLPASEILLSTVVGNFH